MNTFDVFDVCESPHPISVCITNGTVKDRNETIDWFLSKSQYPYLLLLKESDIIFKRYKLGFGPETLAEALIHAHAMTSFPAIAACSNGILRQVSLSGTAWTRATSDIDDNCVFLTRDCVEVVKYFTLPGKSGMMNYINRVNRAAGHSPEHFQVLANCQRYIEFTPSEAEDMTEYKKALAEIKKGKLITSRVK